MLPTLSLERGDSWTIRAARVQICR